MNFCLFLRLVSVIVTLALKQQFFTLIHHYSLLIACLLAEEMTSKSADQHRWRIILFQHSNKSSKVMLWCGVKIMCQHVLFVGWFTLESLYRVVPKMAQFLLNPLTLSNI